MPAGAGLGLGLAPGLAAGEAPGEAVVFGADDEADVGLTVGWAGALPAQAANPTTRDTSAREKARRRNV
jgi:hypothetical protein